MLECRNNSYYAGYYTNRLSKEDHEKVKKLMDPKHFLDPIKAWVVSGVISIFAGDIVGFALPGLAPTPAQVSGNNGKDVLGDPDCAGCGYDLDLSTSTVPGRPRIDPARTNNSSLRVFDAESPGPITSHKVTVVGKNPYYLRLATDLKANALDVDKWSPTRQGDFEQGVIARQDLLVLSSSNRTGYFLHEIQRFVANGYGDSFPFLYPPTMQ